MRFHHWRRPAGSAPGRGASARGLRTGELYDAEPIGPISDLFDLIVPSSWSTAPDHLQLDDQLIRTLALVGYPRYVQTAWLGALIGAGLPLDLSFHLTPRESFAVIRQLSGRMVRLQSSRLLAAGEGRLADPERELALADCESLRDALQRGDERVFSFSLYVTLRGRTTEELDSLTSSVETTFGSQMAQTRRLVFGQEPGFRSTLPECRDWVGARRSLDTSSVAAAFPFASATLSQDDGILYGVNLHDRSLVIFDPFSPDLPNANCCVFAKSGAGKSFAVKLEILRSLVHGVDFCVIDPEGEYERLAKSVGGEVVRLAPSSPHKLNPFDLPARSPDVAGGYAGSAGNAGADEVSDPLAEKLESLLVLFGLLLGPGGGQLSSAERGALHGALRETYLSRGITSDPATQRQEAPVLTDLLATLTERDDPHRLAERLERFASGRVGQVFAGRTNVDLDRRLVVFDVRDLGEELVPVGTQLIADFVWGRARGRSRPLRLVVDEAWSLVRSEAGGRFLSGLARRARKHFLGLTTITQDVGDFLGTEEGRAILQNSAVTLLLRQDVSAIDRVAQTLKLSDGERDLLLRSAKGQGLFCADGNRVALEIVASGAEHRLITSDPRELAAIGREEAAATPVTGTAAQRTVIGSESPRGSRR